MLNGDTHYYGSETTTATTIESTKATSFKNLHATTNNIVTFTAQWTVNEYTITYNLNGGSVNPANPTTYTIESTDITLNNPIKTGYTFL
ncbi:InlB B-repeat-containing protein [bacterium]|nr:InlB B-repeat-containing protein [bacterium]